MCTTAPPPWQDLPALLLGIARTVLVAPILTGAPTMHPSDIELLLRFFLHGASAESGAAAGAAR